jgi:hypothetical protein
MVRDRKEVPNMSEPHELTLTIARRLEVDWQYVERVEAWNTERIAEVRSAGRKAGRLLGYKVITHQAQPDDENRVTVIVAVRESPSEEDHQRMEERSRLLMDDYWSKHLPLDGV